MQPAPVLSPLPSFPFRQRGLMGIGSDYQKTALSTKKYGHWASGSPRALRHACNMLCALPKSFQLVTTVPSCRASQPYCHQAPTLTPCHLSLPSGLSWRYGTAAGVSAVPSGDVGLLGCEPAFAERLSASLAGSGSPPLALDSFRLAGHALSAAGFELPAWQNLSRMPFPQQHARRRHCRHCLQKKVR